MLPMTVTVFSRYTSGETLIWQPVILAGVLYRPAQGQMLTANGPEFSGKTGLSGIYFPINDNTYA